MGEPGKPAMSILEKFRQLSKEKESEHHLESEKKSAKTVGAFYFKNSDPSSVCDRRHWNRKTGRGGAWSGKRKFEGEYSSPHEWKLRRAQEKQKSGGHVGPKEKDVAITEYIGTHPGFKGIIKQRFSDFQVNEISLNGNIVKLRDQEIPKDPDINENEGNFTLEDDSDLLKVLPKEYWDKLFSIVKDEYSLDSVEIEVTDWTKEKRIEVHNTVKNLFKHKIVSNTIERDNKKYLQLSYSKGLGSKGTQRICWKNKLYLHFVLFKENLDTMEAVNLLTHKLHKRSNNMHFCGTKDKRAITTQWFSVKRVAAERLHDLLPLRGIVVGNYKYKKYPLRLGQLKGNRFRMIIRNVDASDDLLADVTESVKKNGFINYFGMQRFGASVIVPTHLIGKTLINRDWKQAVELILKPRPGERSYLDVAEARKVWWETRDAKKALKCMHWKSSCLEAKLLQGLNKNENQGYLNALENLPRNLLMFYCHSYQSLIWNKIVSRRVKEYGLTPLIGDIVLINDDNSNENGEKDGLKNDNKSDIEDDEDEQEEDENNDKEKINDKVTFDEYTLETLKYKTIFLDENNLQDYKIEDVVYPLPGFDIHYPKNSIADWYNEFLKEDNLSQSSLLEMKQYSHLFSLGGTYRKMIEKPDDVHWSIIKYNEENCDLLRSDYDIMKGLEPIKSIPDGKYKALLLEFNLGSSTYATMALREIMKCETSSSHQAILSSKHQPENKEDVPTTSYKDIDKNLTDHNKITNVETVQEKMDT